MKMKKGEIFFCKETSIVLSFYEGKKYEIEFYSDHYETGYVVGIRLNNDVCQPINEKTFKKHFYSKRELRKKGMDEIVGRNI